MFRKTILSVLVLSAVLLFPVSCVDTGLQGGTDYIRFDVATAPTKASPIDAMYYTFDCWGYVYTSEPECPTYLCGETFTRTEGTSYRSAGLHAAVPQGWNLRFWALSPADAPGVEGLPKATSQWPPEFSLSVPASAADQKDLVAAASMVYEGSGTGYSLVFRHLLSCVQFRSALAEVPDCRIRWIEVAGVRGEGVYTEGAGWHSVSGDRSFTVDSDKVLTPSDTDMLLHSPEGSLMLIPQTLGTDAVLRVCLEAGGSASVRWASLSGLELGQGLVTVIRIAVRAGGALGIEVSVQPWSPGREFGE